MNLRTTTLFVLISFVAVVAAGLDVGNARAQSGTSTVTYEVQPGDTLAKIARKYCTTWQEIYERNRSVIGPDPGVLRVGTTLRVPNGCGGSGSGGGGSDGSQTGVYDRGPRSHANGTVSGNRYTVVRGDTVYSIAGRFGVTVDALARANSLSDPRRLVVSTVLTIPGLRPPVTTTPRPTPTPSRTPGPSPTPTCTPPPGTGPFVTIQRPTAGTLLPRTFTVSGRGGGLLEGNVVVRALGSRGEILVEKPTTLQGGGVGTGGSGTWSVELTVSVSSETSGRITASSPDTDAQSSVSVRFSADPTSYKDFTGDECVVMPRVGVPLYDAPAGAVNGSVVAGAIWNAKRGARIEGQYWYLVEPDPGSGNPGQWLRASELMRAAGECTW